MGVLRVDPGDLVVRDRHRLCTGGPLGDFLGTQFQPFHHALVRARNLALQLTEQFRRLGQIEPGHDVGEEVVVDDRGVLVGSGYSVDVETAAAAAVSRQKPRSAQSLAVSTRRSTPSRFMKSWSPLAATYLQRA